MSFRLIYTPGYNRRAARFLKKHPDLASIRKDPETSGDRSLPSCLASALVEGSSKRTPFGFHQHHLPDHAGVDYSGAKDCPGRYWYLGAC